MVADLDKPVLIFPAGYGDGPQVRGLAETLGVQVIGASSLANDPVRVDYTTWVSLPHVTDSGFEAALAAAIAAYGVRLIHASHYAAWFELKTMLPRIAPGVVLSLGRNSFDLTAEYKAKRQQAAEPPAIPELASAGVARQAPSNAMLTGFIRAAMSIPGESYEPKLLAMVEAARRAPQGDVVEIGCLFGRTAALLAMSADHYDLGNVLCVDPWSVRSTEQGNAQLEQSSQGFAWDSFRRIFEVNVAPFSHGRLNYIHALSTDGYRTYAGGCPVETEAFGRVTYEGRIGLLHIDGNHAYEHVVADVRDWVPHMKPEGWVIFDDYDWDWGDGPKRVGDAFLIDEAARIRTAFVAGGALFVQLS